MRKLLIALACTALFAPVAVAQVDHIWLDTRASFHQEVRDGQYHSRFQGEYMNFHMTGRLSPSLDFRVRQRLNKKIDEQNPFNATDFLWLRWQATPRWSFTFGKQAILVGGYEIDSAPIDVYYYGAFSSGWHQYYAFGVNATYSPADGQAVVLQFCPSPLSPGTQDAYTYNLYWNGYLAPWWKTTWSFNIVGDELQRYMNWISLGNKFLMGPLVVDADFINRASFHQPQYLLSDWSLIGKAILSLGKWNLCTKVGYEKNDAANVGADGISYNLILPAGNDYLYGGAGLEYFPLGTDKLRLHLAYFRDNHDNLHNLDIGITWRFSIYGQ